MGVDDDELSRPQRRRQRRAREFLDAAQHIVTTEGFQGLTMARLARELDTVDSAIYRYFPSKGALIAEVQKESIERLQTSLEAITEAGEKRYAAAGLDERAAAVARLVLFGRWFCACNETYPEEIRLLQMIMSQRETALDPEGGMRIFPIAMALMLHAVSALDLAVAAGAVTPASSIDRAIIWSGGISGVMQSDDLEKYAPDLFGGGRLARQANLDLLTGFGVDADLLRQASELVDEMAADGPLAP